MSRILFITSRNIINTSGELRLIKNRTIALEQAYQITTEFYTLASSKRFQSVQEEIGNGSKMHIFQYDGLYAFFLQAIKLSAEFIRRVGIRKETVIISGYVPCFIVKHIKCKCSNIIFYQDVHGATEELLEYGINGRWNLLKRKIKYFLLDKNARQLARLVNGTLVVSNALKEYYSMKYKIDSKNIYVIPCGGLEQQIDLMSYQRARNYWRNEMQMDADRLVFIYSGGVSPWQSIEESVELYLAIREKIKRKCTLLIMSGDLASIRQYENVDKDIRIKSFPAELVNSVLCCGDVGLLLRNESVTNKVAFPNKYYEYLCAGLYIVCAPYVIDQAKLTEEYGIGSLYRGIVNSEFVHAIEQSVEEPLEERKQRIDQLLERLSFQKSLEQFVHQVMG